MIRNDTQISDPDPTFPNKLIRNDTIMFDYNTVVPNPESVWASRFGTTTTYQTRNARLFSFFPGWFRIHLMSPVTLVLGILLVRTGCAFVAVLLIGTVISRLNCFCHCLIFCKTMKPGNDHVNFLWRNITYLLILIHSPQTYWWRRHRKN